MTNSIKNKILSELSSGKRISAKQLNDKFNFNDARKVISVLRSSKHRAGFYTTNPELFPVIVEPSNTVKL